MNDNLPHRLAVALQQRGWRLVLAESCTGGLIAKQLTDLPGSSLWFDRAYISYSNASKQQMLGVDARLIEQQGAVSQAVVVAMASGALERSAAELVLAVSGIAGPGGGSREKPVGTVWFAWGAKDQSLKSECRHFEGDREGVRQQAAVFGMEALLSLLMQGGC